MSEMTSLEMSRRSFLKTAAAIAGVISLSQALRPVHAAEDAVPLFAYVGTFSSPLRDTLPTQVDLPPGNGRGIHIFRVNRETGALTPAGIYEMTTSPSCLTVNRDATRLYSTNETDRVGGSKEGAVSAFAIDGNSGKLKLLNTVGCGGAGPTYVSIDPTQRFLFVANYFGGSVAVLPLELDGRLGNRTQVRMGTGQLGPTKTPSAPPGSFAFSGHDHPHAHMVQVDPSGNSLLFTDLGRDQIYVLRFDPRDGKLGVNQCIAFLPPGDGPRHFAFHPALQPNGIRWLYSIQEEASNIVLFDFDSTTGRLKARQTTSTLPPGFTGSNFCSEILVSPDGRFVYAGNRLHDSVGIFAVGKDGTLSYVGEEWTRGDYPRSFSFDPSGRFFYCCNQRADNVTVFRVDRQTGGLQFTRQYVPVGNPSNIVFVDRKNPG